MTRALLSAIVIASAACGPLQPVPRYPFVEDRTLELASEVLVLDVVADRVDVDATFRFRGEPRDRVASFPVGDGRGGALAFTATLEGGEPPALVPVRRAAPSPVLASPTMPASSESWELDLDGAALARHGGVLRVRYAQRGRGPFTYVLASGAYWRGSIRRLDVVVNDPERRLVSLAIEGQRLDVGASRHVTTLFDVEPRSGVRLDTR